MEEEQRKYHEVAQLFPLMEEAEFEELKADIATNGLLEPIWLHPDGSIIDGRNRHRACLETGIAPEFRTWNGEGSLIEFVLSMNLRRRDLTSGQRAAVAVEALPMLRAEAKGRQAHGLTAPGRTLPQIFAEAFEGESREQAAKLFNTNRQYIQVAWNLQDRAPDLLRDVKHGIKTIAKARWELVARERQESPPLPTDGKYRIIYADPPWQYSRAELDDYGHTRRHYPSMSIDELCLLGETIKALTENDAVLFLWVTSPMLKNAFRIISAWGFSYKTSFVWDKVGHNFGHYNSVRHEFLLVATKGSCAPDVKTLFDSVQVIEKSKTHSEKPEEFRGIIETLYTYGNRIELFARTEVDGWECWGNEPETS